MNTFGMLFTAVVFSFTTPQDDYVKDMALTNEGDYRTFELCKGGIDGLENVVSLNDGDTYKLPVTHRGVCIETVPVEQAGAFMHIAVNASHSGIHVQRYRRVVLPMRDVKACADQIHILNGWKTDKYSNTGFSPDERYLTNGEEGSIIPSYLKEFMEGTVSCSSNTVS